MNAQTAPRFAKGVKLRHDADGSAMLLVPEGALVLNAVAAVALELVDGTRSLDQIVEGVIDRFDVPPERASDDVRSLFGRLTERGFIR